MKLQLNLASLLVLTTLVAIGLAAMIQGPLSELGMKATRGFIIYSVIFAGFLHCLGNTRFHRAARAYCLVAGGHVVLTYMLCGFALNPELTPAAWLLHPIWQAIRTGDAPYVPSWSNFADVGLNAISILLGAMAVALVLCSRDKETSKEPA
jgi:hypothetical protein